MLGREDVWHMPPLRRAELLSNGHPVLAIDLEGADYRGVSLGLPEAFERLTWKTFMKVFRKDEGAPGAVVGHNVRLEQTGVSGPTVVLEKRGEPITFGPYRVLPLPEDGTPFRCRAGVLLDYGARHPAWHPLARVRDPVVAVNEGSIELLLGATYLAIGGRGLKTPSYFTLERQ